MFTFSLKNNKEIFGENIIGLPKQWLWSNYASAWNTGDMPRFFINSITITVVTIAITLIASIMATYASPVVEVKEIGSLSNKTHIEVIRPPP